MEPFGLPFLSTQKIYKKMTPVQYQNDFLSINFLSIVIQTTGRLGGRKIL